MVARKYPYGLTVGFRQTTEVTIEASDLAKRESNEISNQAQLSGGLSGTGMGSLIGRVVDEFEIRREIGRGGMGTVYEAWQKSLNRVVALKVLPTGIGQNETAVQRFRREAQAAAKLSHENIVPIFAIGESDGIYYYTMEYVDGASLYDSICVMRGGSTSTSAVSLTETQPMGGTPHPSAPKSGASGSSTKTPDPADLGLSQTTAEHFYEIARQTAAAADGLQYAHNQGVIHRDIKPHNFLQGTDGRMRITDFGLARIMEQPGVTMTGEFVGSPLYMSPEQITGGRVPVDHRTDIYSLGATMYEWLTLQPPYPGETREQVISRIISSEVRPPRELNASIPVDLETICMKALNKSADVRYQSAGEMSEDLRRFLRSETIKAKRDGIGRRLRKQFTRNRVVAVGVLAAIVAAFFTYTLSSRTTKKKLQQKDLVLNTERLEKEALEQRVESLEAERDNLIESLPADIQLAARTLGAGSEALRDAFSFGMPGSATESVGITRRQADTAASFTEQDAATLALLGEEFQTVAKQLLNNQSRLPNTPTLLATRTLSLSLCQQALEAESLDEALRLVDEVNRTDISFYDAVFLRAVIHARRAEFKDVSQWSEVMLGYNPNRFGGYLMRGLAELFTGDATQSAEDFSRAFAHGAARVPGAYVARGMAQRRLGNLAEALQDYNYAISRDQDHKAASVEQERLFAGLQEELATLTAKLEQNPDDMQSLVHRAETYHLLGKYKQAIEDYDSAIKLKRDPAFYLGRLASTNALARSRGLKRVRRNSQAPGKSGASSTGSINSRFKPPTNAGWQGR